MTEEVVPSMIPLPASRSVSPQLATTAINSGSLALNEPVDIALELQELSGGRTTSDVTLATVPKKQLKLLEICKSRGKAIVLWSFVIGLLGFIVNTTLVTPTLRGAQYAEISTKLTAWQTAKEFQDVCQGIQLSTNISTPECQKALTMTLPAPPLFDSVASSKGVANSRSNGVHKRDLTPELLRSQNSANLRLLHCLTSPFCNTILSYFETALLILGVYGFFRSLVWFSKNSQGWAYGWGFHGCHG